MTERDRETVPSPRRANMAEQKETPQGRYHKAQTVNVNIRLMKNTEQGIIQKLNSVPNKAGYIKALIRADIGKHPINTASLMRWPCFYVPPHSFISASSALVYFRLKSTRCRFFRYHSRSDLSSCFPRARWSRIRTTWARVQSPISL